MSVNTEQILTCDKFKHSDDGFIYFIGYKEGEIVKLLCIILPQLSGCIKYFENGRKNMPFMVKDDDVLDKYNELWGKIKQKLNIKFHNMSVYDETYIKAKVREFDGVIKTNFLGNKTPKENKHYTCNACVTIDSVMRMEKKSYPLVYLEDCKCTVKNAKMPKFIEAEPESDSESDSESKSDTELMAKLESNSDCE